jgi:C4-dicarboxylate transporter, DctM subunit
MDPILLAVLGLLAMFALILLHVPIGVAMGVAGIIGYGLLNNFGASVTLAATETAGVVASLDLAVIPLFLLMGSFAGASGLSADIYKLANAFIGHRRGGLALATIGGCAGFGAVCGSGGTLGMLIPPSIIMVIYAFLTEQFVITLFIAALVPAIIAIALHFLAIAVVVRLDPSAGPAGELMPWSDRWQVVKQSWGVLLLLISVIGGIYGGVFTVNEAAALGAVLAFLFTVFRGKLSLSVLREVVRDAALNTAMIYIIIAGASIFSFFIADTRMPAALTSLITEANLPPLAIIFVLMIMYLILGSVFDTVAAMLITLPFVFPLVMGLGYNPIWWGVILVMVMEVGMITPPIGMNVFVIYGAAKDIALKTIFRGILPFFYADLIRITLIILFPVLALWLPTLLGMK